ncbi:uncharacterized protein LOC141900733 [Tubulanus polymorphus]|uniref:uncharacterized protein LOC141900733 n=1 Tax=Tubulanus polymorphus TaxID=672921 RepID=UPI003DA36BD5
MSSGASTYDPNADCDSDVQIIDVDKEESLVKNAYSDSSTDGADSHVWSVGDHCRAPFTEENGECNYYDGKIVALKRGDTKIMAIVKYDGYNSVDNEEVDVKHLKIMKKLTKRRVVKKKKEVSDTSLFTPLTGTEVQRQLEQKYADLDKFEGMRSALNILDGIDNSETVKRKRRKKPFVATGGREKPSTSFNRQIVVDKSKEKSSSVMTELELETTNEPNSLLTQDIDGLFDFGDDDKSTASSKPETSKAGKKEWECGSGFDDEFMEKPNFSHEPSHRKVPFVLTDDGETQKFQVPSTINQYLRDYQRDGIQFLFDRYKQNAGGILGDDMGLGKTVQVIGFLSAIMNKTGTKHDAILQKPKFIRQMSDSARNIDDGPKEPVLIVCPGSVLYNWIDELETWGYFVAGRFHLSQKEATLSNIRKGKLEIVLTTFDTLREHIAVLNEFRWKAVVVDEVHKIKSLKSQVTEALNRMHTKRRYGLTGTALQNNMIELYSLLNWANPNCLGSPKYFHERFAKAIEMGQKHDANKRQLAEARLRKEKFAKLRKQWMIRRTNDIISDQLPKKDEKVVYCQLTDLQVSVYEAILSHHDVATLILRRREICDCGSGKIRQKCHYSQNSKLEKIRSLIFTYMYLLLKAANHVALLIPDNTPSECQKQAAKEICELAFAEHGDFVNQTRECAFKTLSNPKYCGKMKILKGMLSVLRKEKSKVLLFSYSTKLLDIVEHYVISEGYEYRRLDGKVPDRQRHMMVREFNRDPDLFIFLISTKAGGLGLNLTGANVVIIYDPNWNPTHDLQAQDRAYRIGQRRDVRVYRLISMGTIEENMYLRQIYKQQLDQVAVSDENSRRYFFTNQGDKSGYNELFGIDNMFKLRTGERCLTMEILQRHQQVEENLGIKTSPYVPPNPDMKLDVDEMLNETGNSKNIKLRRSVKRREQERSDSAENLGDISDSDDESVELHELNNSNDLNDELEEDQEKLEDDENSHKCTDEFIDNVATVTEKSLPAKSVRCREIPSRDKCLISSDDSDERPLNKRAAATITDRNSENNVPPRKLKRHKKDVRFDGKSCQESFESVSDVFEKFGVVHIHENKKLIGGSKAEDHMSKCAIKDVYENRMFSQMPAMACDPLSEPEEECSTGEQQCDKSKTENARRYTLQSMMIGSKKVLIGQTPPLIKRGEFEEIAKSSGESLKSFARRIVNLEHDALMKLLETYYSSLDADFGQVFDALNAKVDEKKLTKKNPRPAKASKSVNNKKQLTCPRVRRKAPLKTRKSRKGVEYVISSDDEDVFGRGRSDADLDLDAGPGPSRVSPNRKDDYQIFPGDRDRNCRRIGLNHSSADDYISDNSCGERTAIPDSNRGHLDESKVRNGCDENLRTTTFKKGIGKSSSRREKIEGNDSLVMVHADERSKSAVFDKPALLPRNVSSAAVSESATGIHMTDENSLFLDSFLDFTPARPNRRTFKKPPRNPAPASAADVQITERSSCSAVTENTCADLLDDLFSVGDNDDDAGLRRIDEKRKPPPKKSRKRDNENVDDLFSF